MSTDAIEGGRAGKARLDVLNRMMEPVTTRLLDRIGIPLGATRLDVGCGGGHVVRPDGRVVVADIEGRGAFVGPRRGRASPSS